MALESKTNLQQETLEKVQELIAINIDSNKGFGDAISKIDDVNVTSLFRELAQQREDQAMELQNLVATNREEPAEEGSAAAALHRTWMNLRAALGGGTAAILEEAERGEDIIKDKYEQVLKETSGSAVNDLLQKHYAAVKAGHDRVRDMRDQYKSG